MKLTIVRHGETKARAAKLHQTQEAELSPEGHTQAEEVAQTLADRHFDAIYHSPFTRAVQTKDHIIKYQPPSTPIYPKEGLREISRAGQYEGMSHDSVDLKEMERSWTTAMPGGDSWLGFAGVVVPCLNGLYAAHEEDDLLFVTHGGTMRVINASVGGIALIDAKKIRHPHCSILELTMDHEARPITLPFDAQPGGRM